MPVITLPSAKGGTEAYQLAQPLAFQPAQADALPRVAYAAAHVVNDPGADNDPWLDTALDWEATLAYREHLWSLGLGVAEAMDTAQRGMGLDWSTSLELIERSVGAAKARDGGGLIACGAGTDHLTPGPDVTVDDVIRAYEDQCAAVEAVGGRIILMASRSLAACATGPADYEKVYGHILSQVREPVMIHWLGEMFDPALEGYWGDADHMAAMDVCLDILAAHADKIDGIKISLLDDRKEVSRAGMREWIKDATAGVGITAAALDWIAHALDPNPATRPPPSRLRDHPWLAAVVPGGSLRSGRWRGHRCSSARWRTWTQSASRATSSGSRPRCRRRLGGEWLDLDDLHYFGD